MHLFPVTVIDDFFPNVQEVLDLAKTQEYERFGEANYPGVTSKDYINMTAKEFFIDTKDSDATVNYYSVLFHELTHATGHEKRLNRKNKFDDHKKSYAFEELIAETGSILFGKHFKIEKTVRPNHGP